MRESLVAKEKVDPSIEIKTKPAICKKKDHIKNEF